jgi:hypothetical protein
MLIRALNVRLDNTSILRARKPARAALQVNSAALVYLHAKIALLATTVQL